MNTQLYSKLYETFVCQTDWKTNHHMASEELKQGRSHMDYCSRARQAAPFPVYRRKTDRLDQHEGE